MKRLPNPRAVPIDAIGIYQKLKAVSDKDGHICFIFGAGASVGYSRDNTKYSPPVVAGMFDDSNTAVKSVIRQIQHDSILRRRDDIQEALEEYDGDLEEYLGRLFALNETNDLFNRLLLYLQDLCFLASENIDTNRETNNYLRLIYRMETLRGKKWSCITFNYDTILEKTFIAAGSETRDFSKSEQYLEDPKLIKIHGGINFRYQIIDRSPTTDRRQGDVFRLMMAHSQAAPIGRINLLSDLMSDRITPFHTSKIGPRITNPRLQEKIDFYDFPVMMVPVHNTNKAETEFFKKNMENAVSEIDKSDLVVVIGYNFGDKVFIEEIKKLDLSKKEIILVGGNDFSGNPESNPGYRNLITFWEGKILLFQGAKFSSFIDSIGPKKPSLPEF